jgi:hypothetical protein
MLVARLFWCLILTYSLPPGPLRAESLAAPVAAGPQTNSSAIGSTRQSLPTPAHDETTCAFCQAALFPPWVASGAAVLPELSAWGYRVVLIPDERILHVVSNRPVSSRAPPTLSFA